MDETLAVPRSGMFSLDMPRRTPAPRRRFQQEGSAAKLAQSARKRAKTESQDNMSALQALDAAASECMLEEGGGVSAEGAAAAAAAALLGLEAAGVEGDGAVEGPQHLMDPGLEEEMQSLLACEDIEWSTRQVSKSGSTQFRPALSLPLFLSDQLFCYCHKIGCDRSGGGSHSLFRSPLSRTAAERPVAIGLKGG